VRWFLSLNVFNGLSRVFFWHAVCIKNGTMMAQRFQIAVPSRTLSYCLAGMLAVTGIAAAQDSSQQPHPWRRAGDAPSEQAQQVPFDGDPVSANQAGPNDGPPPPPNYSANQSGNQGYAPQPGGYNQQPGGYNQQPGGYNQQPGGYNQQPQYPAPPQGYSVPASLTIRPGTYVTVHVDQWLSSDKSQQGDTFFASLAEPLVVDGIVVAQRGQTIRGRVTEAQKAGRVEGTSRLGIELTGLTLVDGQQVGIHSQMVTRNGQTSVGRDAGAVAGTTALGAIVGASADYGRGAAIGAGAGAAAGLIGVLLTRGRPTLISPESVLTFQLEAPVTIATDRAPQAFRYAEPGDYGHAGYSSEPAPRAQGPRPAFYPPYYAPYYGPAYYPYYYGSPGFSVFIGPRYSYGGYYFRGGRGFRR
jgi:hypothetical protein